MTAPTPRRVPDRPSDADVDAMRDVYMSRDQRAAYERILAAATAAAPPAEAPGEVSKLADDMERWLDDPFVVLSPMRRMDVEGFIARLRGPNFMGEALAAAPAAPAEGDDLAEWWRKNVPAGTVISNPEWWLTRILRRAAPRVTGGREEWTAAKPAKEGVYAVRGYSIGARYETAIVEVREFDNGFGCNLHLRNSEGDPDEWDEIARYSDRFQWKYLAPLPSEGASFEEVAALQAATGGEGES